MTPDRLETFWTSGWDSTFIVLDALLTQGREVRAHYVRDPQRPSAARELATMEAIRDALAAHAPEAAARLAPLVVVDKDAIAADPEVDRRYRALSARTHVAPQYAWLSRYAAGIGAPVALGIIKRDGGLRDVVRGELVDVDGATVLRTDPSEEAFELFRPFSFPTIERTKLDMRDLARSGGFSDLLARSWFCHAPRRDGSPCGLCTPCHDALALGMAWRLPRAARWRGAVMEAVPDGILRRAVRKALDRISP